MDRCAYLLIFVSSVLMPHAFADDYVAKCAMLTSTGDPSQPVEGMITLTQSDDGGETTIEVELSGFSTTDPEMDHGFHVHAEGNMSDECKAAEGHYNPFNKLHGGPTDTERHVGDLGNIVEDSAGKVKTTIKDSDIKLFGDNNVIGRAIVVHAKRDDLGVNKDDPGSTSTGNAGARIACCPIELTSKPNPSSSVTTRPHQLMITISVMTFVLLVILCYYTSSATHDHYLCDDLRIACCPIELTSRPHRSSSVTTRPHQLTITISVITFVLLVVPSN